MKRPGRTLFLGDFFKRNQFQESFLIVHEKTWGIVHPEPSSNLRADSCSHHLYFVLVPPVVNLTRNPVLVKVRCGGNTPTNTTQHNTTQHTHTVLLCSSHTAAEEALYCLHCLSCSYVHGKEALSAAAAVLMIRYNLSLIHI